MWSVLFFLIVLILSPFNLGDKKHSRFIEDRVAYLKGGMVSHPYLILVTAESVTSVEEEIFKMWAESMNGDSE